jgi:uncharacterized protein YdgA (DUF945 family)
MNKTGIAAGLLLTVGLLAVAGAWYTGGQLEPVLQASVEHGERQLQDAIPGMRAQLELVDVQRGLLQSQARYQLSLQRPGHEPQQWVIADRIEHGPWPWGRVRQLQLQPVMAVSHFQLEESPALAAWFAASGERAPFSGEASIAYDGAVHGTLQTLPLDTRIDGQALQLGALEAQFDSNAEGVIKIAARLERLNLQLTGDYQGQLELDGITLLSDRHPAASGLYAGDSRLALERVELALDGCKPLELSELVQTDRLQEQGGQLAGQFSYSLEQIRIAGRPLGAARMAWSLQQVDAAAAKVVAELYRDYAMRLQQDRAARLDLSQQAALQQALGQLLAGQPSLALEEFWLRTANGEGRLSLALRFAKPEDFDAPLEELLNQLVQTLDASLQLSKPMLSDLLMLQRALQQGGERPGAAGEVQAAVEMAGEVLEASGLARIENRNILSELRYAEGQVVLNGRSMPVEQFLGLLLGLSQLAQQLPAEPQAQ